MTTSTALVEVQTGSGIQTWRMNSAPVNALDPRMVAELSDCLADAQADESISVIVLTSGLRIFSAGADASWMKETLARHGPEGLVDQFNKSMDQFRQLCLSIRRSRLLVIAALNGHTLAGGLELAAACDLRFASAHERLQIGVPEMDLFGAMPTGGGGAQFLARLMGPSRALQFILEAKPVGPNVALGLGLVDRVVATEQLLEEAQAFAMAVARKAGPIGVNAAKRAVLGGSEMSLSDAMELDRAVHWDCMRRGNFLPGVQAFVNQYGGAS